MNDLRRRTWLSDDFSSRAMCDQPSCPWRESNRRPAVIARKAREHARETGHIVRVYDRRVTEYSPYSDEAEATP